MFDDDLQETKYDPRPTAVTARRCASMVVAIAIGLLMCEGLLRILVPTPIYYSTWFTAGVHQVDEEFGFVFRPNYDGAMRNADHVWMQPIRLDANGFRQPATGDDRPGSDSAPESESATRIVMLGGASMAFCYGLSDDESLHHAVADRMTGECRIEMISWPGFTLGQDIGKLVRFTNPDRFDVAVVFAYDEDDFRADDQWDQVQPTGELGMTNSVVGPWDPAASMVGDLYYRSYVLAGFCRTSRVPAGLITRLRDRLGDGNAPAKPVTSASSDDAGGSAVELAARKLRQLGIKSVVIVALPHQGQRVGPASFPNLKSAGIHWLDLRDLPREEDFDWIAYGHYGPESAKCLSVPIAESIASRK